MLNLARNLANNKLINLKPKFVHIDNLIFRFHYRATVLLLLIGVALLSSQEYIGEHIRCLQDNNKLGPVIDRFCFFMATFTVVKHHNRSVLNREIAHPGVGPYVKGEGEEIIRHNYYQWVVFVLFLQAIFFYVPHLIWREMEQGKLKRLTDGLNELQMLNSDKKQQSFHLVEMQLKNRLYLNRSWSTCLIFCETLNVVNLAFQFYLTDKFLGNQFRDLGTKVYWDKKGDEFNPLDVVFPKVTKCTFHKYGPSGSIQYHDIMCIMALNIVNEKIYLVLWFWYIFLFALSVSVLLWRILCFFLKNSIGFNEYVFKFTALNKINKLNLKTVIQNISFGEWMFLSYLAASIRGHLFNDLVAQLADSYEKVAVTSKENEGNVTNEAKEANAFQEDVSKPLVEF